MLLDLICKRYPGRRPSDYYAGLDEYQAFQLDAALALRGKIEDSDDNQLLIWQLLDGMRMVAQSQGAKVKKIPMPERTIQEPSDEEPLLADLLNQLGGAGMVMVQENG